MPTARKVHSFTNDGWIRCNWFGTPSSGRCEKEGYELYKSVFHEHAREIPCDHPMANHISYVFCSERCKRYYLNSHHDMGNLPAGFKTVL